MGVPAFPVGGPDAGTPGAIPLLFSGFVLGVFSGVLPILGLYWGPIVIAVSCAFVFLLVLVLFVLVWLWVVGVLL